jgi:WD40 repeat protein
MRQLTIDHGRFHSLAFHPRGRFLASLDSWGSLRLWDLATYTQRLSASVPAFWGDRLELAPSGDHLLVGGRVLNCKPLVDQFHTGVRSRPLELGTKALVDKYCLAFAPDGQAIARCVRVAPTGKLADLQLCDLAGRSLKDLPGPGYINPSLPHAVAFAPDGRHLAATQVNYSVRTWDLASGEEVSCLEHTERVHAVAYSPSGRFLATLAEGVLRFWEAATGQCRLKRKDFRRDAFGLAFHPSGRYLLGGGTEGVVRLWNAFDREVTAWDWQIGPIRRVAFSPEGMTAAACGEQTIVVWDVEADVV